MARQGSLEGAVLHALWESAGPLTARQVADALTGRNLARTTVLTVLARLTRKRLVVRSDEEYPHTYRPAVSREEYVADMMLDALGQAPDRQAALTRFLGGVSRTDTEYLQRELRRRNPPD